MAEEDILPFDPTMKKKKKKKKTGFDLEAAMGEPTEDSGSSAAAADGQPSAPAPEEEPEEKTASEAQPAQEKVTDDFSLDFSNMKKKKKKKKPLDLDELGEALPDAGDSETTQSSAATEDFSVDDLNFSNMKKKKRKPVNLDALDDAQDEDNEEQTDSVGAHNAWIGSDRDYTYDELLKRVFDIMREKNPDMVAGEKKKFVMRPPQVLRVGTRKTSFANFADICRLLHRQPKHVLAFLLAELGTRLHRQPKHVLAFLLAELGTSGSVDGNNQLIIRGKYTQKQIENVLRRYIKEYVTCHTCRSRDTLLQKETRLFFLQCETCGSRCSVAGIKAGFQAVTSKRAAIRAKTA
ncbi:eukaryotic translation initiation factor 2 subunit 2 [Plakobranchus ocellatus]|uniref:Eukaryotic translation initiation factor 2 subunit 2 n=1 Tax=Plakobranchus ocellatus TaxID=259542 RepID=A0AAV4E0S6_9GAST|nr:eukaryotic translation initiation factor 2 subunit 2 [Plakobranchus ocellatus]